MTPEIEPTPKISGNAFNGDRLMTSRPMPHLYHADKTNVVSLSDWCENNFITKNQGRTLLRRKLLVGFRRHHVWWVAANPDCINELLEYLGVDELAFDAINNWLVSNPIGSHNR